MNFLVVVDTNVWLSGLYWKNGVASSVLDRFDSGDITPCFSLETFLEWEEKASAMANTQKALLVYSNYWKYLRQSAVFVQPNEHVSICRDPDDDKFLDVATEVKAKYLISGDRDLLVIKKFRNTHIITPREFLTIMA